MSLEATASSKAAGAAGACPSAVMHVYKPAIVMLFGVLGMLAVRDEDMFAKTHPGVRNAKKSSTTYAKIVLDILSGLPNDLSLSATRMTSCRSGDSPRAPARNSWHSLSRATSSRLQRRWPRVSKSKLLRESSDSPRPAASCPRRGKC